MLSQFSIKRVIAAVVLFFLVGSFLILTVSAQPILLETYSDPIGLFPLTNINWGTLAPGDSVTKEFYLKNLAADEIESVSFTMEQVEPALAQEYLHLNSQDLPVVIGKDQLEKVAVTLQVDPAINSVQDFSFTILISVYMKEPNLEINASDEASPNGGGGGGGGGGSNPTPKPSASASIPAEQNSLPTTQKFLFIIMVFCVIYLIGGGKKR